MNGPGSTLFPSFWSAPSLCSISFWVCSVGKTTKIFYSFTYLFTWTTFKNNHVLCNSLHSESLPKSERRPGHVESSRSCESVSSWTKTCTATWSGSLTLKSWMPTERAKVSAVKWTTSAPNQLWRYCWITPVVFLSGLLPLTSGDSDTDSLYDLEGKSRIVYY